MQGTRSSLLASNIARAHGLRQTVPSHTRISLNRQLRHARPQLLTPYAQKQFSQSSRLNYPRKDSQDKDSINREPTEYSKSGTDDGAAGQEEAAFDPSITDPGEEKEKAGEGKPVSLLYSAIGISNASGRCEGMRRMPVAHTLYWQRNMVPSHALLLVFRYKRSREASS